MAADNATGNPMDIAGTAAALAEFYAVGSDQRSDAYLQGKQRLSSGRHELAAAWSKLRPTLADARPGRVLDWGCRHGVFAWLAQREFGEATELHGCDTCPAELYRPFHEAIGLHYQQLQHPWQLPYDDGSFDLVCAGGVLEHVPNDGESLTELWRVLRPGGLLVLTHLPNAASISEWASRRWWPHQAHLRRYRSADLRRRLLSRGLVPQRWGYHHLLPATLPDTGQSRSRFAAVLETLYRLNPLLERIWPLNRLSATIWVVAEKRDGL